MSVVAAVEDAVPEAVMVQTPALLAQPLHEGGGARGQLA